VPDPDEFVYVADLLPEDAMGTLASVRIVRYMDSEGALRTAWSVEGEPDFATAIGMTCLARAALEREWLSEEVES
jgi:hypothetical protein